MIKIIKRGTRQQATCDRCGCIFSYEEEDIMHLENHNGEYHFAEGTKYDYKNFVVCPQCHHDFVINQTRYILAEKEEQE